MTGKFILCFMHLCVQWVGSCQGSVSAAGRGSMSPGMALPMHTAPWDSLLSFSIMVPFHVPAPCSCSAGGSHPSAPQPPLPPGYSPVVTSPFLPWAQPCFEGSAAWDQSAFHVGDLGRSGAAGQRNSNKQFLS